MLERAIDHHGVPDKITMDKSGANIVEHDHRAIQCIIQPLLGFQTFRCARILLAGMETFYMIKNGQLDDPDGQVASAAEPFYSLAA